MQLKKVEFINGVAQLEPDNVILLGGSSSKNVYKNWTLKQQWRERMGWVQRCSLQNHFPDNCSVFRRNLGWGQSTTTKTARIRTKT